MQIFRRSVSDALHVSAMAARLATTRSSLPVSADVASPASKLEIHSDSLSDHASATGSLKRPALHRPNSWTKYVLDEKDARFRIPV